MIITDSHCHLDILAQHSNLKDVIQAANNKGIKYLHSICVQLKDIKSILNITENFSNIFASIGVHPKYATSAVTPAKKLITLSKHKNIISIGETGLDFLQDNSKCQQQISSLQEHIIAAQNTNLPVVIHTRNAEQSTIDIISELKKHKEFSGQIHCFTGSKIFAKKILDLDMYISISGIVTFKNTESIQNALKYIPLNKLLVETDSPYLAPVPKRGHINKPEYIYYTIKHLAYLKGKNPEFIAQETTKNFFQLFTKAKTHLNQI